MVGQRNRRIHFQSGLFGRVEVETLLVSTQQITLVVGSVEYRLAVHFFLVYVSVYHRFR